ncbi:uncharacterized protein LOC101461596 isoform X2 [Ceratitis capitata]|uniref:Dipeptidase n=1 Tax=Ceratitis capitata TaxID=7213 RepID=W8B509_CERCA|nr:uncharacterized protein LOC101461596 isoform X2 [Ceratitis capitata]
MYTMELRPLSYEEIYQMEMLQPSELGGTNTSTMLPIIMIPSSAITPGSSILATPQHRHDKEVANDENIYQFEPIHLLSPPSTTTNKVVLQKELVPDFLNGCTTLIQPQAFLPPKTEERQQHSPHNLHIQQLPLTQKQIPQTQLQQSLPATLNIIYAGTITSTPQTRETLERATLSHDFVPAIIDNNLGADTTIGDESDFEGSECGASVSGATCIPHFRFSGCSMIPHSTITANSCGVSGIHSQQQNHHQEPEVVGCAAFSQMMGTFAAAAGDAISSARFSGTLGSLTGVGAGPSSTLGRSRPTSYQTGPFYQISKRVSFKDDNFPQENIKECLRSQKLFNNGNNENTDALHNCSYMHHNNFTDYQTTDFSGLPDVTEHSNTRRTLSRQNSLSNSDSGGDIAKIEKSKVNFCDGRPQPTPHIANTKRKSKPSHYAASHRCNRRHRLKPRRGSWAIFVTFVATVCLLTIATMLAYQHFVVPNRHSHAQRLKIVRRILKEVPLVDGQNNFAWNVRKYAHNSLESVPMRRNSNAEGWIRPAWAQTDIERLKQGLVGVQMWSAYVPCEALGLDAVQVAIEQIDIIRRLTEMYSLDTELAKSSKDILTAQQHHKMASLIGIKGGHAIGSSLAVLRSFYSVGARALSLTHKCDLSWAGSSASVSESGLSAFGKAVIREMNRLGMMVDLSYSSTATARDVLQVTRAPVIFSHSAARQLCNSTRNVPDDILRLVADNGGLIMVSFDSEDIACGEQAYLQDVVEHIRHIRAIAGVQHIGLGAGYDSIEVPPVGLEDVSKYPDLLATLLQDSNWSEQDIAMLAGKNFIRILETVENVRDYWKRADIQPIEQTEPQPKPHCSHWSS